MEPLAPTENHKPFRAGGVLLVCGLAALFAAAHFERSVVDGEPWRDLLIAVDAPAVPEGAVPLRARPIPETNLPLETQAFLERQGIASERSFKVREVQRPNVVDEIKSGAIALVINTPIGKTSQFDDAYIRKAAIKYKVPYLTTVAAARAAVVGIEASRSGRAGVKSLQSYHADIR